jgi:hypothetical protein
MAVRTTKCDWGAKRSRPRPSSKKLEILQKILPRALNYPLEPRIKTHRLTRKFPRLVQKESIRTDIGFRVARRSQCRAVG